MDQLDTQRFKTTFFISTGRTGTKAIAQYFGQCFHNVTALHEPKPSRKLRMSSTARLAGRRSRQQLVNELFEARLRICKQISTDHYVEANPFLFGFVDVIAEVFDSPRVVHVVRDPRTMIRSALNFKSQRGIKWFFSRFVPNWILKPELLDKSPEKKWSQMSPLERIAWYWVTVNSHIQKECLVHHDQARRVRFEDLFQEDGSGIREIAEWIGLHEEPGLLDDMLQTRVNASRGKEMNPWKDWSESERKIVFKYCGELMEEYGYTK